MPQQWKDSTDIEPRIVTRVWSRRRAPAQGWRLEYEAESQEQAKRQLEMLRDDRPGVVAMISRNKPRRG